ncbi:GspH/FimT family pseudopilin [Agitococcus lubricus]|uniref:Type II secretion system protein H n=1 Tax=Agitococcus lubricus TaxID=1077255 RepID=A0A2T5J2D3_9GAMM|nr:GspH/FimT family pseudopilin [Agitococcus lubricus]PTQ90681.1 prepilin-type N-terminal cleavage/methylation domain-containing protein [Agitococcus lubricus]
MQYNKGFTIIELMVTLTIAVIILTMAVPMTQTIQANARVRSVASDFASSLADARAKALLEHRDISFVAISPGDINNLWGAGGWRATQVINGTVTTVFENRAIPSTVSIAPSQNLNTFLFDNVTGAVKNAAGAPVNINFTICDGNVDDETGSIINLTSTGRIIVRRDTTNTVCL